MTIFVFTVLSLMLPEMVILQGVDKCVDVNGGMHKEGEIYYCAGSQFCNKCQCLEGKSAVMTRMYCGSSDQTKESVEAFKCVDNSGTIHGINATYTHPDGCNVCQCYEYGGVCTKVFCMPQKVKSISTDCGKDMNGRKYEPGEAVPSGSCNTCHCGIMGIICTKMACADDGFTKITDDNNVKCRTHDNKEIAKGKSYMSHDGCNVCVCTGNGGENGLACTKVGCRLRYQQMVKNNPILRNGGQDLKTSATAMTMLLMLPKFLMML